MRQAVGRQTAPVADRVARLIAGNAPTDEGFLERLRRDELSLSDEDTATTTDRPVVILAGRRDRVAGYRGLVGALSHSSGVDLLLSANAGHYLPLEEPDFFAAGLERWAARCAQG